MEKRLIKDEPHEDILVLTEGDNFHIGRQSAVSSVLCIPKHLLKNDEYIKLVMYCYEKGYEQGDIHGRWWVRSEFKKLMDLQW